MIIDAHNHLGGPDKGDGRSQSPEEIIETMDSCGIEYAVVFPFNEAEPGLSFCRTNDYIAKAASAHPDRLIGFCRLDPNAGDDATRELDRCVNDLGLRGVKLHPTSQRFGLDHPVLADILAEAERLRVPVVFDTGKAMSPPSGIAALAARYPGLTFIMAHINLLEESIAASEAAPNIYLGTTGYFNLKRLGEAVARVGAHRFIMGSDSPYIKMRREVEKIGQTPGLSEAWKASIQGENARRVLGL